MASRALVPPIDMNLPPKGNPWRRWVSGLIYFITFCILGTICLLWALGYRVNWVAETIEQTGIVELSTPQVGLHPNVFVNGERQSSSLPISLRWLFPGHYDIRIEQSGYQTWEKLIIVGNNERIDYPSVLLLYAVPQTIDPPTIRTDQIVNRTYDNRGIEIRSGNELWVDGAFITRTSDDMLNPEYYFDSKHIIYQAGDEVIVRDLVSSTSQTVLTLKSKTPVSYVTQDNGRVLIYLEDGTVKAVALYQATNIIDRLGVTR